MAIEETAELAAEALPEQIPVPTPVPLPDGDEAPNLAEEAAAELPASDDGPAPTPAGPLTVGRMVADALRRAGVRWAFTVPGESFLGLIDGLEAAGIRVVATRHEGAAAFKIGRASCRERV